MTELTESQGEVIAAAVAAEIKAFTDTARGSNGAAQEFQGMRNRHEQYWQFCTNEDCQKPGHIAERGYIKIGPSMKTNKGAEDVRRFRDTKHAEPLPKFGQYEVGYELHQNASSRLPFGKFTPIVTQPGGIAAFPREQIIEMGWHRNPLIRKARPDVADVVDVRCPFGCRNKLFATEEAKRQHVEAAHEKQMVSTALGEQISKPMEQIAALVAKQQGGDPAQIASIVGAVMAAMNMNSTAPETVAVEEVPDTIEDADEPATGVNILSGRDILTDTRVRTRGPRVPALAQG